MKSYNVCRLCGKSNYEQHRYDLIHYSVRHNAHADCALAKWGASFFDRLTPWQLTQFPVLAAIEAGLMDALRAAAAARPHVSTYKSPLEVK